MRKTRQRNRNSWISVLLIAGLLPISSGCWKPFVGSGADLGEAISEQEEQPLTIGDLAVPIGVNHLKVESVALVTGLNGSGSNPPPGMQRATLLDEMKSHEVENPNNLLASANTALVLVRAYMPPGVQKGDRFDIEVISPSNSSNATLSSGWLMRSRLREVALVNHAIHSGHVAALAEGPILIHALFRGSDDDTDNMSGLVLGGGLSRMDRPMGLVVRSQHSSVKTSSRVGTAINERFHIGRRISQKGVATPMRDNYIEITLHPRYKKNVARYIQVIRHIVLVESPGDRLRRVELLERKLLEPTTAAEAALQLEAIGQLAAPVLKQGLSSADHEVQFYSAEALAYLDEPAAAAALARLASQHHAFRWHALAALASMDHVAALDALSALLDVPSAETRFGAFRALQARNSAAPLVQGNAMSDFTFHQLPTTQSPVVHFSVSDTAKMVVFGMELEMRPTNFLYAGKEILIRPSGEDQLQVSRFVPGQPDRVIRCSPALVDVVDAISKVGGGYAEVLQCFHQASSNGAIDASVLVGARPRPGRSYYREDSSQQPDSSTDIQVLNPLPDLFTNRLLWGRDTGPGTDQSADGNDTIRP